MLRVVDLMKTPSLQFITDIQNISMIKLIICSKSILQCAVA